MKKWSVLLVLVMLLSLVGCQGKAADSVATAPPEADAAAQALPDLPMVDITEKMFIAQCNDVYLNPDEYQGKAIRLEGMYQNFEDSTDGTQYHYVMRNSPGCCGADGTIGFEFLFDGEMPQFNDWIEVVGTVEKVTLGESEYIVLRALKVTVLNERGAEFVSN